MNSIIELRNLSKNQKWRRLTRNIWNGMKINIWRIPSIRYRKLRNACKILRVWTKKWRKFWKIVRKFSNFLIKISMENWLFSLFSTKYLWDFCLFSESIYPWKKKQVFYNNFSDGVGGSGVPPPDVLVYLGGKENFLSGRLYSRILWASLNNLQLYNSNK